MALPTGILGRIGSTPLVALARIGADLPVPVLVKCEHLNPGGSVKDRLALAIVDDAERRGVLRPGATIVEATAGNTGVGLALVAAVRGYRLVCVMPAKMSVDKRVALAQLGAEVVITENAPLADPRNFQNVARAPRGGARLVPRRPVREPREPRRPRGDDRARDPRAGRRAHRRVRGGRRHRRHDHGCRALPAAAPARRRARSSPTRSDRCWPSGSRARRATRTPPTRSRASGRVRRRWSWIARSSTVPSASPTRSRSRWRAGCCARRACSSAARPGPRWSPRCGSRPGASVDGPVVALLPDGWDRYRSQPWLQALAGDYGPGA